MILATIFSHFRVFVIDLVDGMQQAYNIYRTNSAWKMITWNILQKRSLIKSVSVFGLKQSPYR